MKNLNKHNVLEFYVWSGIENGRFLVPTRLIWLYYGAYCAENNIIVLDIKWFAREFNKIHPQNNKAYKGGHVFISKNTRESLLKWTSINHPTVDLSKYYINKKKVGVYSKLFHEKSKRPTKPIVDSRGRVFSSHYMASKCLKIAEGNIYSVLHGKLQSTSNLKFWHMTPEEVAQIPKGTKEGAPFFKAVKPIIPKE